MSARLGPRSIFFWALGLMGAAIAAGLVVQQFGLGWRGALVALVILAVAMVALMRSAEKRSEDIGAASPALKRYNNRMVVCSMLYMVGFFIATMAYRHWGVEGSWLWVVACLPSVGILGMVWSMGRLLMEETDEYLRTRIVQQALFGIGAVLVVTTVWGFFEQFGLVPHVPSWMVLPIFAASMGLSACIRWVRS